MNMQKEDPNEQSDLSHPADNLSNANKEKRARMLRRALAVLRELQELESFINEELELYENSKPPRMRRDRKQERKDLYDRYFIRKGY